MKKLIPFILLAAFSTNAWSQTTSFLLTTAPCNHDGLLGVYFTGLTPPLTVNWTTYGSNGMTITHTGVSGLSDALTGYSGGPISVTAKDALGVNSAPGFYGGVPPFVISLSSTSVICPGLDTASASITSGGVGPFTYTWYNYNTLGTAGTGSKLALPQGEYGLTVTDGAGCVYGSMDDNSLIVNLSSITTFANTFITSPASCTNGSAQAVVYGGGTPPFSYVWTNGSTDSVITGLVSGTYGVIVTDAEGCTYPGFATVYIPQSVSISASFTTSPATCSANNGTIAATGTGGTAPYSFIWNNGATTPSLSGIAGGYYTVDITDANGCIGSSGANVGATPRIAFTYSTTPSLCSAPTGTASVYPSGGTGYYSIVWYTWPEQTGTSATGLEPGTYYFTITDATGCERDSFVVISPIDVIHASFTAVSSLCASASGSLSAYPTGGVPPYHYLWSTGASTPGISSVPAGLYSVNITDNLGCTVKLTNTISEYSPLGIGLLPKDESCLGANDGSITADAFGGTPPYSYGWTGGGTTRTITGLPGGYYHLQVTDAAGCKATDSTHLGYDSTSYCYCIISGKVFQDLNNNCVQDSGEPGIPNIQIHISGMGYAYTNDSGYYSYPVPSGTYTITETLKPFYPMSSCDVSSKSLIVATGVPGCINTVNFANATDTVHDMQIRTWSYLNSAPVAGNPYTQVTIVTNNGSVPEDSVLASYKNDAQLIAPTSFVPALIFNGRSGYYNTQGTFPAVNPGFSKAIYTNYQVPTNIATGTGLLTIDSVAYDTPMSVMAVDYTPWNNVCNFTTSVVAGSASNFKEVYPQGSGPIGEIPYEDSILEYMVHFQNNEAYQAENVTVLDTIDGNLDWTTLSPVYMSAPCQVSVNQVGSFRVASFVFNNINLPSSSADLMRSNGMFSYTIKTKSGLAVGTQFRNSASIYFDDYGPVKTNSTINTLSSVYVSGIKNVGAGNYNTFSIFPNPASGSFSAVINTDIAGTGFMTLSEVSGKVLINNQVNLQTGTQTLKTDVSALAPGVYFVTLVQNGKTQTQKLVILK